jgi:mono/diheme cytochrome c family protein
MSHIRIVVFSALLVFVPACARRATEAPPAVAIMPEPSGPAIVYEGTAPPPRPVTRAPADDTIPPPRPVLHEPVDESLALEGRKLFLRLQCIKCHTAAPDAKAPTLEGLYGTKVALKGGATAIVDEAYLVESIRKPRVKVVDGWEPIMPAYDESKVSAEELNALVAYIKSLKSGDLNRREERFPPPVGAPTEPKRDAVPSPREK